MRSPLNPPLMAAMICILQLGLSFAAEPSQAQTRKPTAREIASIRDCVTRNKDDLDEGERRCLFNLVAEPCIGNPSAAADKAMEVDCYRIEDSIWDGLLNDNYKGLLETLDDEQTAKARAMQHAWVGLPRYHVRVLSRQNPGLDGDHHARRLCDARVGTTGDAAYVLQSIVSADEAADVWLESAMRCTGKASMKPCVNLY